MEERVPPDGSRWPATRWLRMGVGLTLLVVLVLMGRRLGALVPGFAAWVDGLGIWGPVGYMVGYFVAPVAFVPGSLLTMAAGILFGLGRGTLYAFVGASVGSCLAFLVARYVLRDRLRRRLGDNPRLIAIDRAIGSKGRQIVFLLRMAPVFPFNLLNYALGLTRVRFVDYVLGSLGMLPATLLYVYYGKLLGDLGALAGGVAPERGVGYYAVMGAGLAATIAVTALVTRAARRALREATAEATSAAPPSPDERP